MSPNPAQTAPSNGGVDQERNLTITKARNAGVTSNVDKLRRGLSGLISSKNPASYFIPIATNAQQQPQKLAKINVNSENSEIIKLGDESSGQKEGEMHQNKNQNLQQVSGGQPLVAEPSTLVNGAATGDGMMNLLPRQNRPIGHHRWG